MKFAPILLAAAAQLAAQTSGFAPFTCNPGVQAQRVVRSEGRTELVADVVVTCTGGSPVPNGQPIPAADVTLTFNASVTSRILAGGGASETLLLLDEPQPGAQFACLASPCTAIGNGIGSGYYSAKGNPNVLQGLVAPGPNSITWRGVPFDPPGVQGTRIFRFTNIRLDPSSAAGATLTMTSSALVGQVPLQTFGGQLTVATLQPSLSVAVRDAANVASAPGGVPVTLAAGGSGPIRVGTLRFTTATAAAGGPRTIVPSASGAPLPIQSFPPPPQAQDSPGAFYVSESGFYSPVLPSLRNGSNLGGAGLADSGTRLMATFTNVPPNVSVYVALLNDGADPAALLARLTAADATGSGPFSAVTSSTAFAQLPVVNGTADAVWEVLNNALDIANLDFDFGVYFAYPANIFSSPGPVGVSMRYAPNGGAGVPRFGGAAATRPFATLTATATPPAAPVLSVSPSSFTFRATAGGSNPPPQSLSISTIPSGLAFGVTDSLGLQFRIQPASGNTPATSQVSIDIRGLSAGTYNDTLTVSSPQNTANVPVTLILSPGPLIRSLAPASAAQGSPAFPLTVNGANFPPGTTVAWNGAPIATTFVGASVLTAAVPASLLASAGTASITAVAPDGTISNAVSFAITPFRLTAISPGLVAAGGPVFTLTATGEGFQTGAALSVGGSTIQASNVSATSLTAAVPAAAISAPGTLSVTIVNPNGQFTNALTLTVVPPVVLTRISPDTVTETGASFGLTLSGSGFAPGAVVRVGSANLTPAAGGSASQLAVTVPADMIAHPGVIAVSVANPNGLVSHSLNLTVRPAPRLVSLNPSSRTAGAAGFALLAQGANLDGATVRWNGQSLPTSAAGTQLGATVSASLVATPGTAQLTAVSADGVVSNALPFTIVPGLSITALSPPTANVGSATFTLTVNGSNLEGAIVNWNGQSLGSTGGSATQTSAQVPSALLTAATTANITVSTPDGAVSNPLPFRVVLPTLDSVSFSAPPSAGSGADQTVTVGLGASFPLDLRGTLTITFTPDSGLPDDPAIQFQNGSRVMTFTVPAGSSALPAVLAKTGTVAGVITITLGFTTTTGADVTPAGITPQRIQVGRAAPVITSIACQRSATGFTIVADGYTNTREATQATFDFTAATGASLGTAQLVVTAGPLFGAWFGSAGAAGAGGVFRYTQPFNVQGNATIVSGLSLRLANSAGASPAASCPLQ